MLYQSHLSCNVWKAGGTEVQIKLLGKVSSPESRTFFIGSFCLFVCSQCGPSFAVSENPLKVLQLWGRGISWKLSFFLKSLELTYYPMNKTFTWVQTFTQLPGKRELIWQVLYYIQKSSPVSGVVLVRLWICFISPQLNLEFWQNLITQKQMPLDSAWACWLSGQHLARSLGSEIKLQRFEWYLGQVLHFHSFPKPNNDSCKHFGTVC